MSKVQSALTAILVAAVVFLIVERFSSNQETYPLQNEVEAIKKEFYLYYLSEGDYPKNKEFLSKTSTNIIKSYPNQFKWSEKGVYLYFKPNNSSTERTIGEPGEVFEHNCQVYKVHGIWNQGNKDNYEASEAELEKAGIQLN